MILLLIATLTTAAAYYDSIPMVDIETLTLKKGQMTTSRRVPPMLQLTCTGRYCESWLQPETVQCYNQGSDGIGIQWRCDAELDNSVKFGAIEVSCEGYSFSGDPTVLVGSCALEYQLVGTGAGPQRYAPRDVYSSDYFVAIAACSMIGLFAMVVIFMVCAASARAVHPTPVVQAPPVIHVPPVPPVVIIDDSPPVVYSNGCGGGGYGRPYYRSYGSGWGGSSWDGGGGSSRPNSSSSSSGSHKSSGYGGSRSR